MEVWKEGGKEGREGERKGERNNGWTRQADEWMMNYPILQIKKLRPKEEK